MTKSEKRLLEVIIAHPGLLWYEAGEKAWPNRTIQRVNYRGQPFRELNGGALDLTNRVLDSLEAEGLIERRGLCYYPVVTPNKEKSK